MCSPRRLLIADDEPQLCGVLKEHFEDLGYEVATAGGGAEALARGQETVFTVAVLDVKMPDFGGVALLRRLRENQPGLEAVLLTAFGSIEDAVQAVREGAFTYLTKPVKLDELEVHVQRACELTELRRQVSQWREDARRGEKDPEIVGESPALAAVLRQVAQVAPTDTTVLVEGESGTGKELVARAIHRRSPRADRPFVVADCATFRESILDSELFGHERGAFTGANEERPGLVQIADQGTLFIDEIAEMSIACQLRFLRLLETGEFRRVGGARAIGASIRAVAATHRTLSEEVSAGRFREDLYYRLNVFRIVVPPLRERIADLPTLLHRFLLRASRKHGRDFEIGRDAYERLLRHPWPGNVRELAHVIERATLVCPDGVIETEHLALPRTTAVGGASEASLTTLDENERRHIARVLAHTDFNKRGAARILGISLRNLYRKIERFGIAPPK